MKKQFILSKLLFCFIYFFAACQVQADTPSTKSPVLIPTKISTQIPAKTVTITPLPVTPTPKIPVGVETPFPTSEIVIGKTNIQNIKELGHVRPPFNLILESNNGDYIYKVGDNSIKIYSSANPDSIFQDLAVVTIKNPDNSFNPNNFGISANGLFFFSVTSDGIRIFSNEGDLMGTIEKPIGDFSISLSPDGSFIAIAQNYDIQVMDVSNGKSVYSGKGKKVKFSPQGSLVGIQQSARLVLLNINNWTLFKDFPQDAESGWDFSPDGSMLASIFQNKIQIFDLLENNIYKSNLGMFSTNLAFSVDGKMILEIYDSQDGPLFVNGWNIENFEEISQDDIHGIEWRFDSKTLLWKSGIEKQRVGFNNGFAIFINTYTFTEISCFLSSKSSVECNMNSYPNIFSRQGNNWYGFNNSYENDFTVEIINANTTGSNSSKYLSFPATEFGKTMTESHMDYELLAIDEEQKIALIKKSAYFFPAESRLIDLNSASIIKKWTRVLDQPLFSPDGRYMAFMYKTVLQIYDLENKEILGIKEIGSIESMVFSRDSRYLAIAFNNEKHGTLNSRVAILEVEKINDIHLYPTTIFEQAITMEEVFSNRINSIDYSKDNSVLIIGFNNGMVACIDPMSGKNIYSWEAHPLGGLLNAKFFPDGKDLLTTGSDGSIKIWGLPSYIWP